MTRGRLAAMIRPAIMNEAIGSQYEAPVHNVRAEEMMTAAEPIVSART